MTRHSLVIICCYLYTLFDMATPHFPELDFDEYGKKETSLSLKDILPLNPKQYDKHRAPKFLGQPTVVYFHVTVLSLDSINEESMCGICVHIVFPTATDVRGRHISRAELAGLKIAIAGEHVRGLQDSRCGLAAQHLEARLLLQECKESYLPRDVDTKPLSLAVSRQNAALHVQIDIGALLRDEVRVLSSRHSDLFDDDREPFSHDARPGVPLEHDRSPCGESGDRAAATRHIEQLHDRLYDRILHRKLHVHTDCLQSAPETGLSPVPYVHPVRPDRSHVLDRLLDQAGSHPGAGHARCDVTIDPRHSKHAVSAISAAGLVREGNRCVDVFVQRVRLPVPHGIRSSEQLYGTHRHEGHEGLLGRGSSRGHRRFQDTDATRR
ncbi:uncharacterized protein LOC105277249 isoform X5 [Ooceraea biroi]|uniref:uncharacterized protein LOC105277249 isoform X5 n=1 Tax=Ooceraea biroi TaxID=2015173 RepID=UPI0005BE6DAF|nr:uncharacterized protein LOC105277249 isoform X5 [Ooceraea biroi]